MKDLRALNLQRCEITDQGLKHLEGLKNLEELNLSYSNVTEDGMVSLKGLTKLRKLDLSWASRRNESAIEGEGDSFKLDSLKELINLEELSLYQVCLGPGDGLKPLAHLSKLRRLNLQGTRITDEGFGHMKSLDHIQHLVISETKVTDDSLKQIAGMTELRELYLGNSGVTDSGLGYLKKLAKLEVLDLKGTDITSKGLEKLRGLSHLIRLVINEEVETTFDSDLLEANPRLKIVRNEFSGGV
jgi:Leucine-rich repeat (LRR) protein